MEDLRASRVVIVEVEGEMTLGEVETEVLPPIQNCRTIENQEGSPEAEEDVSSTVGGNSLPQIQSNKRPRARRRTLKCIPVCASTRCDKGKSSCGLDTSVQRQPSA